MLSRQLVQHKGEQIMRSSVVYYLPEFVQIHVIESVMLSNRLILCHPLLLLPSVFPSLRVFSNESTLQVAKVLELQL